MSVYRHWNDRISSMEASESVQDAPNAKKHETIYWNATLLVDRNGGIIFSRLSRSFMQKKIQIRYFGTCWMRRCVTGCYRAKRSISTHHLFCFIMLFGLWLITRTKLAGVRCSMADLAWNGVDYKMTVTQDSGPREAPTTGAADTDGKLNWFA